jgi:hypothetical protein
VLAHQAPLKRGNALAEVANQWDPTLHGTRGCRRLVAEAVTGTSQTAEDGLELLGGGGQRSPRSSSKRLRQQNASHRQLDDHRPTAKDNQQLPTDLPTRQLPRRRTCNRRTPRPPNGVEQQPGRSPVPTAPSSARVVVRGVYPFRRCAITSSSSSKTTQRMSALPQSSGMEGVPPVSLAGAAQSRAARLNGASDLGSPARLRPKGADRARPR